MPKYYNTPEFKALRQDWDQKLKAGGFNDIETTTLNAQGTALGPYTIQSGRPRRRNAKDSAKLLGFFMKLDGYLANAPAELRYIDRLMLTLWSRGESIVSIAVETGYCERQVRRILSYYKKIVLAL